MATREYAWVLHPAPPVAGRCVLVCAHTPEYRLLAQQLPGPGTAVLEVGCDVGLCTLQLASSAARVVATDKSPSHTVLAAEALRDLANVEVARCDVLASPPDVLAELGRGCQMVWLDIGGNRERDGVERAIAALVDAIGPTLIVVKSLELARRLSGTPDGLRLTRQRRWLLNKLLGRVAAQLQRAVAGAGRQALDTRFDTRRMQKLTKCYAERRIVDGICARFVGGSGLELADLEAVAEQVQGWLAAEETVASADGVPWLLSACPDGVVVVKYVGEDLCSYLDTVRLGCDGEVG